MEIIEMRIDEESGQVSWGCNWCSALHESEAVMRRHAQKHDIGPDLSDEEMAELIEEMAAIEEEKQSMARTAKEIQEQIDKLEAARKVTTARNGYRHYTDRINYLRGELALQREKEQGESFEEVIHVPMEPVRSAEEKRAPVQPKARVCNACGQRYYTPWSPSDNSHCDACKQPRFRKRFMAFD